MPFSPLRPPERRAGLAVVAGFAFLTVYFSGLFPPFSNPNELSRFEAVFAFVENGTFQIDRAIRMLGDHEDKALSGGRFYSNKAPGLALAGIPLYWLLRVFFPAPGSPHAAIFLLLRILVVSSICVLALHRFRARIATSHAGTLITFAVAFGTPFLFYARSFFAHAWTAALLFLAWDLLTVAERDETHRRVNWRIAGAGFLAAWAGVAEYTVLPLLLLLAVRSFSRRSGRRFILFSAGASLPLAALLFYNAVCFGSPWVLSSAREAHGSYAELARTGAFGFGLPSAAVAGNFLFHPARGLLLFSPFWLWAAAGFAKWWRSGEDRRDCAFALAAVVLHFVLLTGYPNWHGGWSLGNRYLLPVIFLAALSLTHALNSPLSRGLFAAAVFFSAANHFLLTASWPYFPVDLPWPSATGSLWFLNREWVAGNFLSRLGLFSLLLPVGISLAAFATAARASGRSSPRAFAGALLAFLVFGLSLLRPPEPPYSAKLWRAAIYGAYSGKDAERQELKGVVLSAATPLEHRQAAGAWRLYGATP